MEPTNEPGPAQGNRKLEAAVDGSLERDYQEYQKKEQERVAVEMQNEAKLAAEKFADIQKLGFLTKKDIEEHDKNLFGKFVSELEAMRQENVKLREWVMRAKAQGLNSGATDDKPKDETTLKSHDRFKW